MAADGVDERSPLLSAPRSGHVTPTAPPYLPESGPGGPPEPEVPTPAQPSRPESNPSLKQDTLCQGGQMNSRPVGETTS
ncbi:uncharacterized protein RBU33_016293 isoform 4-T9 [Hipposideros larvatus]